MPTPAAQAHACLQAVADASAAPAMQAYMKHHFAFFGIATPKRRAAIRELGVRWRERTALLQACAALWDYPQRECHYVALDWLWQYRKLLLQEDIVWLRQLARRHVWWDSIDGFAKIIGYLVLHAPDQPAAQAAMQDALQDADFWQRRIAMLHQLPCKEKTDQARLFAFALALAHEKEFFIRKAIGWALREYARVAPQAVAAFLAQHRERFSGLTLREAAKHLRDE
ncbi:DNA alkylation repair protein [Massilia sp. W12]|uniref:DNA alkylation repair protein n=1 Tax=Massilia sp. W12 TaxID=3126507 RepID=UPI0030D02CF0